MPRHRPVSSRTLLVLIAALPTVALFTTWAAAGGGYAAAVWYPSLLAMVALLGATLAGLGPARPSFSQPTKVALSAFALYVAWSYLSIAWAANHGAALDGSNRALLFFAIFALFSALPWTPGAAGVCATAFVLGVGGVAVVTLMRLATQDGAAAGMFIDARLSAPFGYQSADAAIWTLTALMAVALAAERAQPALLRGVETALASVCLELALLSQSRGWLITLPIVVGLCLAFSPHRLRLALWGLAPTVVAVALAPQLTQVYNAPGALGGLAGERAAAQAAAGPAAVGLALAALVVALGTVLARADRGQRAPARLVTAIRAAMATAAMAGLIGVLCTDALASANGMWSDFRHDTPVRSSSPRFTQPGSGRYDIWRASLIALREHPLGGLGQDNFSASYLVHRRTAQEPRWTHGIVFRLLTHTGVVGFLSFAAFIVAALMAALRERRLVSPARRAAVAVAVIPATVWLVYGSVDWFWEFPGLSGPALAFLAAAGALMRPPGQAWAAPNPRWWRPAASMAAAVAVGGAALVAIVPRYVAQQQTGRALATADNNPAGAIRMLDRAATLDPFDAQERQFAGTVAQASGRLAQARAELTLAASADPANWLTQVQLGLLASTHGRPAQARRRYETARKLNPREPVITQALKRVWTPHPLTYREVVAELRLRLDTRFGTGDST